MKKKLLIVAGLLAGLLVVASVVLSLLVKKYLSSDNLKALILPRVEVATGRKAGIDEIRVSLFSGVHVEGISLKEEDGKTDFVKVREFQIKYSLLPLLKKQLVIKDLRLIEPEILIVRDKRGDFNFDDILKRIKTSSSKKGKTSVTSKDESGKGLPVSLVTDRIYVKDARVEFRDDSKILPFIKAITNMNFSFSMDRKTMVPRVRGTLKLSRLEVITSKKTVTGQGVINIEPDAIKGDFTVELEGDRISKKIVITDPFGRPHIRADIYSKHLDLEKFLALMPSSEQSKARGSKKTAKAGKTPERVVRKPLNITAVGTMKVDEAVYRGYRIRDFNLAYTYKDEIFTVKPLSLKITGGDVVEAKGDASGEITLKYSTAVADPVALARRTAKGYLRARLTEGVIKRSRITEAVALFTGLKDMRNLTFKIAEFLFKIANERVNIKGNILSDYMTADVRGLMNFDKKLNLTTLLRLSPRASGGLAYRITKVGLFEDEKGWTEVPLKITGIADKPSVGLDPSYLKKGAERQIERELEKRGIDTSPVKNLFKKLF